MSIASLSDCIKLVSREDILTVKLITGQQQQQQQQQQQDLDYGYESELEQEENPVKKTITYREKELVIDDNFFHIDHKQQQQKLGKDIKKLGQVTHGQLRKYKRIPKYVIDKSELSKRKQKSLLSKRAWKGRSKDEQYWRDHKYTPNYY